MQAKLAGVFALFCFLTFSGTVFCQTQAEVEKYVNMIRQDLQAEKVQLITKNMEFTVEESSAFWPVYEKYQQEFRKIGDEKVALMKDYATHYVWRGSYRSRIKSIV